MITEGLALGRHFRRLWKEDGIAGSLDWVKLEKLVFQDDYLSALESAAGVRRVVQTEVELGWFQCGTLKHVSVLYFGVCRFGSLGALCKGLHGGSIPDVRLLHGGTRGTVFNPFTRGRSHDERQRNFPWAHQLAGRLRV